VKSSRPAVLIDDNELRVVQAHRTNARRRPGQLMGNRFEITVRGVEPTALLKAMPHLERIAELGLPNRFGHQRFGHRGINPVLGRCLLRRDYEGLLSNWLGQNGPEWPDMETDRRRLFDQGRWVEAATAWPFRWKPERAALMAMHRRGSIDDAINAVPTRIKRLWVDALQSEIFNQALVQREANDLLYTIGEDDIVTVFDDFHELLGDPDGPTRSATGPLFGRRMRPPGASIKLVESKVLEASGLDNRSFGGGAHAPGGARRPFVVPVLRAKGESGVDDRGGYLKFDFSLPKGAYATTALDVLGFGDVLTPGRPRGGA
jgi:tRNA pseudouridine13 synthase